MNEEIVFGIVDGICTGYSDPNHHNSCSCNHSGIKTQRAKETSRAEIARDEAYLQASRGNFISVVENKRGAGKMASDLSLMKERILSMEKCWWEIE